MDNSCENCKYDYCSCSDEPCRECSHNGGIIDKFVANDPTRDEKLNAIKKYCSGTEYCGDCPLRDTMGNCFGGHVEGEQIEKNYDILFGNHSEEASPISNETKPDSIKPEYYNDTKITPIDVIDDWRLNFYLGSAIKYIKRAGKKANNSKLQDLKKVRAYIDHEIKVEEARE